MEMDAMSASGNFDLSSGSPDRPLCASRHRGCYRPSLLDRAGSFRENMENPLLSSLPNMSRSSSSVTQGDVCNFFQCLRFDPKSMVVEHKLNPSREFKRLAGAAIGIPLEDSLPASSKSKQVSSPSLDDLRRLKSGLRESGTKARERVKIFNDCLSVINKWFPTVPSRKRSRLDALSNDQPNTHVSIDRSLSLLGGGKMGYQNYASVSGLELEQHESEERSKIAIPSKRARTSMVDARAGTPARLPGTMDKGSDVIKVSNSSAVQGLDRTLSVPLDGWENSRLKKKRTGIKPNAAPSSVATKPFGGDREAKQAMQPQVSSKARSRLTDAYGFRSGIANGGPGSGKVKVTSQTSSGIRLSICKTDSDNDSLLHGGKERPSGKERVNLKAVNNANSREDFSSGSPILGSKLNANARAHRSASVGGASKLSQVVQRSASPNDWGLSSCTNKLPGVLGANNRKRAPCTQSSSPSVVNWVQRPQKISRTARRTHFLPIFTGNDDKYAGDPTPDMMANEGRFSAGSPLKVKIKSNNFSRAALSESEESGATEIMSRDKNKDNEIYEGSGQDVQEVSTLLLPPRKSKAVSRDDYGHGVRKQRKTGRGVTSSRAVLHLTSENTGSVGITKQIRSSGLIHKTKRACRPPTRKLSDRKAYTRKKHIATSMAADFLAVSDDGREELLAAANAVMKTAQALSGPFWKKMESLFRFISNADISYLKDQVNPDFVVDASTSALLDTDREMPNGCGFNEYGREEFDSRIIELIPEHSALTPSGISLYQRLVAALISEEENEELLCGGKDVLGYDVYGSGLDVENNIESDIFPRLMSEGYDLSGYPTSSGYSVNSHRISFDEVDHSVRGDNIVPIQDTGYDRLRNDLLADQLMPGAECSKYQYHNMSMHERLLMEVHSIGIYPDLVSDLAQSIDEEKSGDNCRLNEVYLEQKYQEKVLVKKGLVGKLLGSASEAKALQEKEFEGLALDKLVLMTYEHYTRCSHGTKTASGKMAKQAGLALVRRALERCQEFEATGKSCFGEPLYLEMFHSGVSCLMDGTALTCIRNESDKIHLGGSGCSLELRTSAPVGTQRSPSSNNQDVYSSEVVLSANLGAEPHTSKEDSWSNGVKKRELLLDDVSGTISTSLGGSLSCSAKGKRSERDRERKRNSGVGLSRSGNLKIGRPSSATVKGYRKSKAKPKQKTAELPASINGPLGKMSDQSKVMLSSTLSRSEIAKDKNDYNLDVLEEPIDLSGLQLPEMDDLGASIDLDGQGDDLGSWFNSIDDDGLQDHDYMGGLGIPKDNLADLNMMV
ncbi:uncharacterized protein LOC105161884 isoform X1 [Sesamum indicum]|uniref:Uncharacterized protein LOC105161884 isoform X1 n=2 Tax=Sesamum indicum TaxID=4182 RepID=A0A6I9T302_SESIN|nr:uncharacterized protein LOC105161884 isoform X1 [Sesamum indicum]XP_011078032.1 uncharacterized protein LOC105161884 isoform X1 [Sesamum indicum]